MNDLEEISELELNRGLATLLNTVAESPYGAGIKVIGNRDHIVHEDRSLEACYPDYCDSWDEVMSIAIEYGVFVKPLAWERTGELYRASHIALDEEGVMTNFGTRFISDDEDPIKAIVMTLIKVLKEKNKE